MIPANPWLPPEPAPSEPEAALAPRKANARFLLEHPAHCIALGFGAGLSPWAPGTVGTLWGWLAWLVLQRSLDAGQLGLLIAGGTLLGWWACAVTARNLRVSDPGCIVWDEILAIWLILWLAMPMGIWGQIVAFALFRYFDAAKPGPVAWADTRFKGFGAAGAFGILFDDFVAAFCTLLVIALWRF